MNSREVNGRRATGRRLGGSKRSHGKGVGRAPASDLELVLLDRRLLQRLRVDQGLTMNQVKDRLDDIDNGDTVSRTTVDRAFNGNGVRPDKAKLIADLVGKTVLQLLSPFDPRYELPVQVADGVSWEWEIDSFLQPGGIETSNGLHYFSLQDAASPYKVPVWTGKVLPVERIVCGRASAKARTATATR